jgi:hypothetical protein
LPKPSPLDVVVGDEPSEVEPVGLAEELEESPSPTLPEPSPLDVVVGDELSGVEPVGLPNPDVGEPLPEPSPLDGFVVGDELSGLEPVEPVRELKAS